MVPSTTETHTLSLHDALPISAFMSPPPASARHPAVRGARSRSASRRAPLSPRVRRSAGACRCACLGVRSEEHTSELQSPYDLVCRLLLEKKHCQPSRSWRWDL